MSLPKIEVMIPVVEKDVKNLPFCIHNLKKYSANPIRKITILGLSKLKNQAPTDPLVQWIDEEMVTPRLSDIESELEKTGYAYKSARWYFQQLLKLYAFHSTQPLTDHILIHDADIAFVNDVVFVDEENRGLLAFGYPFRWKLNTRKHEIPEKHMAINTAQKLLPEWNIVDPFSGMQHHMVLERTILNTLFERVEQHHQKEFWQAFINSIDLERWHGISEYVIYRHFAIKNFPEKVLSQHVNGIDVITSATNTQCSLEQILSGYYPKNTTMVACHQLTDYKSSLKASDYIPESLRNDLMKHLTPLALYLDAGMLRIQPVTVPSSTEESIRLFP